MWIEIFREKRTKIVRLKVLLINTTGSQWVPPPHLYTICQSNSLN